MLSYTCDYAKEHYIRWNDFQQGHRCPCSKSVALSGPNNTNWSGGYFYGDYCPAWRDKEYKQDIRDRDQNKCLNPYCDSKKPDDLVIHHINYDKKDCHFKNLITVCRSCNNKANKDRDWHQDWYQALLHNRYGYNY